MWIRSSKNIFEMIDVGADYICGDPDELAQDGEDVPDDWYLLFTLPNGSHKKIDVEDKYMAMLILDRIHAGIIKGENIINIDMKKNQ